MATLKIKKSLQDDGKIPRECYLCLKNATRSGSQRHVDARRDCNNLWLSIAVLSYEQKRMGKIHPFFVGAGNRVTNLVLRRGLFFAKLILRKTIQFQGIGEVLRQYYRAKHKREA